MRDPARILIVDDSPLNLDILDTRLRHGGYEVLKAADGVEALESAQKHEPDLILLDVMMPKLDGFEVCRRLRADPAASFVPIILITAKTEPKDVVAGLDAGADEYLTKPFEHTALLARVRSMLRIKSLHDTVREQTRRLEAQAIELAQWNQTLEARVTRQVEELERMGRLRRFFAPQIADLIVRGDTADPWAPHRREVTVVFVDLRGFTAFAESTSAAEVMAVLGEYHQALGPIVLAHEGTLERFTGDGMMVFFNDPLPVADAAERAVRMAMQMRSCAGALAASWRQRGFDLDVGIGIAHGVATLGAIGFEGRWDYSAIGSVTNLAARLCAEAHGGQILISDVVQSKVDGRVRTERLDDLTLKGFPRPVPAWSVRPDNPSPIRRSSPP